MVRWECTKCKTTWWCAGLICPKCPECEAEEINPTGETDEDDVDELMAREADND